MPTTNGSSPIQLEAILASLTNSGFLELESVGPGRGGIASRARFYSGLAERSHNGDWKFQLSPSAATAQERVSAVDFHDSLWVSIPVPSRRNMQGYGSIQCSNVQYPFPTDPPFVPDANPSISKRITVPSMMGSSPT